MDGPQHTVPPDCVSAADYERHAQARLPADVWAYIAGAGADGLTQRWNREAFDGVRLAGRVLADMKAASTESTLFGRELPVPILIAPVAHQKLVHSDGELAAVLGASAVSAWMTVSTLSSVRLEEIAQASQTTLWFQLYMQTTREATLSLVRRAEAAGYAAIVVTVDAPVNGVRNTEQRAGFRLPAHVRPVNIEGVQGPVLRAGPGESPVFKGLLDHAPTWADVEWLCSETTLPVLIKGIVHPDDAERAIACGVDGIVVSNHGGRTLDTLPSSLDALEAVARRVAGRVPLLLDGGIRRGTDVLKALALGANAVMVGQPILHALAVAGPVGVIHLLTILRAEFEAAMALTGCARVGDITQSVVWEMR
ncbi:alpha-hydroxy acid oxidase [Hyphomicrobium sp.]|uniref:alpha-hydroxy acid oxidase n=1 Tax=Hyphomicrobium sp. TaxID=82 RepID=UPI002BD05DAB|nr:alpha-hydroxy acid oxidase [Hyphomicrobium sp.]HRN87108.1 alpha-hydroxy acid oxidase [Hyphomicrobium sp.]HRQ25487.1 alpha-hydroxy acid oxidase [Hyphomicrobium sp.]